MKTYRPLVLGWCGHFPERPNNRVLKHKQWEKSAKQDGNGDGLAVRLGEGLTYSALLGNRPTVRGD
jgi:hypothetical protein